MRGRFSDLNKINIFSYQFHCLQLDKSNQYFFFLFNEMCTLFTGLLIKPTHIQLMLSKL